MQKKNLDSHENKFKWKSLKKDIDYRLIKAKEYRSILRSDMDKILDWMLPHNGEEEILVEVDHFYDLGWEEEYEGPGPDLMRQRQLDYPNVYTDFFGEVVPRITGSISSVSSAIIIYAIFISPQGLSTIYHRLIFGMSVTDILKALAMALTTLPMPKESAAVDRYGFDGPRLGNVHTCEAQGFFIVFGMFTTYTYIGALSVYYFCAIALSMPESVIKKKVEPYLHIIPILVGLINAVPPLFIQMYNPHSGDAWCTVIRLLYWCKGEGCVRGNEFYRKPYLNMTMSFTAINFLCILVCLSLVFRKVLKENRMLIEYNRNNNDADAQDDNTVQRRNILKTRHRTIRIVAVQSLGYVLGLFLTLFSFVIGIYGGIARVENLNNRYIRLIFEPSQGFFNLLIFIFSKVAILRKVNPNMGYCSLLAKIFCRNSRDAPVQIPIDDMLSGIEFSRDEEGNVVVVESFLDDEGISYNPSAWYSYSSRPTLENNEEPSAAVSSQLISKDGTRAEGVIPSPEKKKGEGQQIQLRRRTEEGITDC